jgi:hypothetical protein
MLGALSLGVKWLGHEADHSPLSSAKVKNVCSYTSSPPYVFMMWSLVKHRDNFTFTLKFYYPSQQMLFMKKLLLLYLII